MFSLILVILFDNVATLTVFLYIFAVPFFHLSIYCDLDSNLLFSFIHNSMNTELHRYGGGLMDTEGRDVSSTPDTKQAGPLAKATTDASLVSNVSVPHADIYHISAPSQRSATALQRQGQRSAEKWKGPDKISKIYGDWIDDVE